MCLLGPNPWGPVWNSDWWRICVTFNYPPHMNHVDLVWDIDVSSRSHPMSTSVELWLVEIMCIKRICASSNHPPHMNHCEPSLRNWRVFYILPHKNQCGILTGRECVYHPATHPTWTIVDLVWEIDVSTTSHPMRTSVELWQVENVCIIQPPTPHEPLWT